MSNFYENYDQRVYDYSIPTVLFKDGNMFDIKFYYFFVLVLCVDHINLMKTNLVVDYIIFEDTMMHLWSELYNSMNYN